MFLTSKHTLLSIVMLFLYIFFLLLIGISSITLLYAPAFLFYGDYIQPIEAGIEIYSVLFLSNMLPVAPSKRLTKMEKEARCVGKQRGNRRVKTNPCWSDIGFWL